MSEKKERIPGLIWLAVRTGTCAIGISAMLLIPAAYLIWRGSAGEGSIPALILISALIAGIAASLLQKTGRKHGVLCVPLSIIFSAFLLFLLSAVLPGTESKLTDILLSTASLGFGIGIGWIMQNNKTDRGKRKKRRNITVRNHGR